MKTFYLIATLLFLVSSEISHAQAPDWLWAENTSCGTGTNIVTGMTTDISGNVYLGGFFQSRSLALGSSTLTNSDSGKSDLFIMKIDPSGHTIWMQNAVNSGDSYTNSVSTDAHGNVYLVGTFTGPYLIIANDTIINSSHQCFFILKYDSSGNRIWIRTIDGGTENSIGGVCTDSAGNVFITGGFTAPYLILGNDTLFNTGASRIFVAKYGPSGNIVWAKSAGGNNLDNLGGETYITDFGSAIYTDVMGNVNVSGQFQGTFLILGNDSFACPANSDNIFIAKYDPAGNVIWAASPSVSPTNPGPGGLISTSGISADANGNVYLMGGFYYDTIAFGIYTLTSTLGLGQSPMFFVKYNYSGQVAWAEPIGVTTQYSGVGPGVNGMYTDALGNTSLAGNFNAPNIILGHDTLFNTDTVTTSGSQDIFIAKYDPSGHEIWAKTAGVYFNNSPTSTANWFPTVISADTAGHLYVAGLLANPIGYSGNDTFTGNVDAIFTFGADTLICPTGGGTESFIAKLDTSTNIAKYTGISPINPTSTITVYPNPSTGSFYFSGLTEGSTIEVYDVMGQEITSPNPLQRRGLSSQYNVVDLSGRAAGVYFYRVIDQNNVIQNGKMVKQ